MTVHGGVVSTRPWRKAAIGPVVLAAADEIQFVLRIEVMIEAKVHLIAIEILSETRECVVAAVAPNPAEAGGVQAVADGSKVIRKGHAVEKLFDETAGIRTGAQRIPREHIERLQGTRRAVRRYGIAGEIHCRVVRIGIGAGHARKVPVDALARGCGEDGRGHDIALNRSHAFIEKEKEGLVFDDRSAEAAAELVAIEIR